MGTSWTRYFLQLFVLHAAFRTFVASTPCDIAKDNHPLSETKVVTLDIQTKTAGTYRNRLDTISVCVMQDGKECFPMQVDDQRFEVQKLLDYFQTTLPGSNFSLPPLSRYPERGPRNPSMEDMKGEKHEFNAHFLSRYIALEIQIKSMFCESGICNITERGLRIQPDTFKCLAGRRPSTTLRFSDFQTEHESLRRDIELYELVASTCYYLAKTREDSKSYVPGLAKIQRTPESGVETMDICFLLAGAACFPRTHAEERNFLEYLLKGAADGMEIRRTQAFQDWNCKSGKCSGGKCADGTRDQNLVFKPEIKKSAAARHLVPSVIPWVIISVIYTTILINYNSN